MSSDRVPRKLTKGLSSLHFVPLSPAQRQEGSPTPECYIIEIIPETQNAASFVVTTTVYDHRTRLYL